MYFILSKLIAIINELCNKKMARGGGFEHLLLRYDNGRNIKSEVLN